jgi:perosamine synthetase
MKYSVSQPLFGKEEMRLVVDAMTTGWITHGRRVQEFESLLADYLGVEDVIACSNGTVGLHLALAALGIGPGDEVLVPDLTYVATANAVAYTGATPVLVDIDPETWNIDLDEAMLHLSPKTRAIIPVHLYGVPCDMTRMMEFARRAGLLVVEDAAEAFGGSWAGKSCGSFGHAGVFSFYGNKVLTTGEGGAVATDDRALAERLRLLRGQGQTPGRRYHHATLGYNYRLTDLQAAVGVGQFTHLDEMLDRRQAVCEIYREKLSRFGYSSMEVCIDDAQRIFAPWLFTMQLMINPRDLLIEALAEAGVETRPTFVPLHRLPMYAQDDSLFRIASLIGDMGLSLPTHPGLSDSDAKVIADIVTRKAEQICLQ